MSAIVPAVAVPQSPDSPAARYGKSSDFGQVLDFIQTIISNKALRKEFDIPHLVVVGRQNMAKTTLINRLIGRYLLPMRRAETATHLQALTTNPTILNLRHGTCSRVEVKCDSIPGLGGSVNDPTDVEVEAFLRKVSEKLPKEPGTLISKTPINVTLEGKWRHFHFVSLVLCFFLLLLLLLLFARIKRERERAGEMRDRQRQKDRGG